MARPHGTKHIETPEKLLEYFNQYKAENEKERIVVPQSHVKLGIVYLDYIPPISMEGFQVWLYKKGIIGTIKDYIANRDNRYDDYVNIISYIKEEIFAHNFKYASVGAYKENLIARQLGMVDKSENKTEVNVKTFNAEFNQAIQSPPQSSDNTQLDK
jgi:hypothetical protein